MAYLKYNEYMNKDVLVYNQSQEEGNKAICEILAQEIDKNIGGQIENKIWHGSPVWFSEGNPVVGYAVRKNNVQLLFWSGQSFDEPDLKVEGSFKAAEARYTSPEQINIEDLARWCQKALDIQYNYKDIVKNRGKLELL